MPHSRTIVTAKARARNTTAARSVEYLNAAAGPNLSRSLSTDMPASEDKSPAMTSTTGYDISASRDARRATSPAEIVAPSAIVATTAPEYDSNISAPSPATSPTLSPTLSAMTPGFLGSSSGIPASTLPTRSAPTSAVFVYIPPPTLAKSAIEDAPMANPFMTAASSGLP